MCIRYKQVGRRLGTMTTTSAQPQARVAPQVVGAPVPYVAMTLVVYLVNESLYFDLIGRRYIFYSLIYMFI